MKHIIKRLEKIPFAKSFTRNYPKSDYGPGRVIKVKIRFDDECGNGHNTFSITGDIYHPGNNDIDCGGCIHDEIAKYFPKLKKYIQWHLVSSDGPMHYIANTMYHAEEEKEGIPNSWDDMFKFNGFPMTFDLKKDFVKFLQEDKSGFDFEVIAISHKEKKTYSDNYTFGGFGNTWYDCPFHSEREALEFLDCLHVCKGFTLVKTITGTSDEKLSDITAARESACWPDATLKQLQNKEILLKRLPEMMLQFERDMIELKELGAAS